MRRRRRALWALGALALAIALLYPGTPFGARVLGAEDLLYLRPPLTQLKPSTLERPSNPFLADAVEVFRPDLRWARGQVHDGRLPLWSARVFTGFPLAASQQTALLWPLNAVVLALPFDDGAALAALLGIMLAALGAAVLCRFTLGLGVAPAALAAVAYGASAYLFSWLEHPHHHAWAVMPWALAAAARAAETRRARDIGLLAAAFALLAAAGHPQSALMAGTLALAFGLRRRVRSLPLLAAGAALGAAAGAVLLLPFLELLGQSVDVSRASGPLPRSAVLSVFMPERWGRPDWAFVGEGPANYLERTFYVGVVPLVLAVVAVTVRRRHRDAVFFAAAAAVCLAAALDTGPVSSALTAVPPFSLVAIARLLGPVTLCLVVLGALGLEVLLRDPSAVRRLTIAAAAAVLAAPLVWLARHPVELRALPDSLRSMSPFGEAVDQAHAGAGAALRWLLIAAAFALLAFALARRPRAAAWLAAAAVALTALDLVTLDRGFHPAIDRALLAPPRTPGVELALERQGSGRVLGDGEFLIPNVDVTAGLRDPRGHGLPVLRRVQRLYAAYGGWGFQGTRFFVDAPGADRLADAFGAHLLLTGWREQDPAIAGLERLLEGADERVYSNPSALPRAYVAGSWRDAASEDEARTLAVGSTTAQLRAQPVIEGAGAPPAGAEGDGEAAVEVDDDQRVRVRVRSDRPGQLVLLDSFYPGWRATVDGRTVEIRAANGAFRAVAVPAGESVVEFRYRPLSVLLGAVISVLALAGIAVLLLRRPSV